jgi:hypothetical protein
MFQCQECGQYTADATITAPNDPEAAHTAIVISPDVCKRCDSENLVAICFGSKHMQMWGQLVKTLIDFRDYAGNNLPEKTLRSLGSKALDFILALETQHYDTPD